MNIKQQKQLIRNVQQMLLDAGMKQAELKNQMAATEFQNTIAALEHVVISLDILSALGNAHSKLIAITALGKAKPEVANSFVALFVHGNHKEDKVLCRDCFKREIEPNPIAHSYTNLKYGRCSYCNLEILYPKTMDDWKREVSEVERDLNTGKEKTDA